MNKFIGKAAKKPIKKKIAVKKETPKAEIEIIKKGVQEFITCPKCGWLHTADTKRCRFCGKKLGE